MWNGFKRDAIKFETVWWVFRGSYSAIWSNVSSLQRDAQKASNKRSERIPSIPFFSSSVLSSTPSFSHSHSHFLSQTPHSTHIKRILSMKYEKEKWDMQTTLKKIAGCEILDAGNLIFSFSSSKSSSSLLGQTLLSWVNDGKVMIHVRWISWLTSHRICYQVQALV